MRRTLAVPVALMAICAALEAGGVGSAIMYAEIALLVVLLAWLLLVASDVVRAAIGEPRLAELGAATWLEGHDVRVVRRGPERSAFVLGPVRPRIYVSDALIAVLDRAQLQAVLRHEEHHCRRRDPLRSVALDAWQRLFGWVPVVRRWLVRRSADLEIAADDYAIRRGVSRSALASALLNCDAPSARPAFGVDATANVRIHRLVSSRSELRPTTPGEWLTPFMAAVGLVACRVLLG